MISEFGALVVLDPEEASRRVMAALGEAGGDREAAARKLGLTRPTFYRVLARLGLGLKVRELHARRTGPRGPRKKKTPAR